MTAKPTKPTKADLQRKIMELTAQLAHVYHFADTTIAKAGTDYMMASGVLLHLSGIGGKDIIPPVMIKDGLSAETITALRKDLARSYELAVAFKPKA